MKTSKEILQIAKIIATNAHSGQFRKITNEPYIKHPERVSLLVKQKWNSPQYQPDLQTIAILHDVLEDSNLTTKNLISLDIPDYLTVIIQQLSRNPNESYFNFIMRIKDCHWARKVKLADLEDNMHDLGEGSLKDKYRFAHYILSQSEDYWSKIK